MLEIANLEVVYNDVVLVLRGLSLEVKDGQIVALLGANGAGKTTTLRAITGLLDVHEGDITKGSIDLAGERIDGKDASVIVKSGIAQVMEGRRVFAEMTVDENLRTGSITNRNGASVKASYDRVMTLFPVLKDRRKATAGYLSGGEQQMLAIGRALMADPKLLILDEPSLGLAPMLVQQIRDIIVSINAAGDVGAAHRAERQHGAVDRPLRLHHGDREGRDGRRPEEAVAGRGRPRVLPRPPRRRRSQELPRSEALQEAEAVAVMSVDPSRPVSRIPWPVSRIPYGSGRAAGHGLRATDCRCRR